jgi:hypothetical protein
LVVDGHLLDDGALVHSVLQPGSQVQLQRRSSARAGTSERRHFQVRMCVTGCMLT